MFLNVATSKLSMMTLTGARTREPLVLVPQDPRLIIRMELVCTQAWALLEAFVIDTEILSAVPYVFCPNQFVVI